WLALISVPLAVALIYFTTSGRGQTSRPPETPPEKPAPAAVDPPKPPDAQPASVAPEPAPGAPPPAAPAAPPPPAPPPAAVAPPTPGTSPAEVAPKPPEATKAEPVDRLSVAVTAKQPCWVSATVDGQKKIERMLQPGEQETVEVRREMVITAGDATAISLT